MPPSPRGNSADWIQLLRSLGNLDISADGVLNLKDVSGARISISQALPQQENIRILRSRRYRQRRVSSVGPVKILYTISRNDNWEFWIGGDTSPRKAFALPWIREGKYLYPALAKITNTGPGETNWVIFIQVFKESELTATEIGRVVREFRMSQSEQSCFVIYHDRGYELIQDPTTGGGGGGGIGSGGGGIGSGGGGA